jgi:hypothetical protein
MHGTFLIVIKVQRLHITCGPANTEPSFSHPVPPAFDPLGVTRHSGEVANLYAVILSSTKMVLRCSILDVRKVTCRRAGPFLVLWNAVRKDGGGSDVGRSIGGATESFSTG